MIDKDNIIKIVTELLTEQQFLVDVQVKTGNVIRVFIDNYNGLSIEECQYISKGIELKLNRDEEDFELEVSSPGIGKAFKVEAQYQKNIGKIIDITCKDGEKILGVLIAKNENDIIVMPEIKNRKNKNIEEVKPILINLNNIKSVSEVIKF